MHIIHAVRAHAHVHTHTHTLMHKWNRTAASVASLSFWAHMPLKEGVRETSQVRPVKSTRLRAHTVNVDMHKCTCYNKFLMRQTKGVWFMVLFLPILK